MEASLMMSPDDNELRARSALEALAAEAAAFEDGDVVRKTCLLCGEAKVKSEEYYPGRYAYCRVCEKLRGRLRALNMDAAAMREALATHGIEELSRRVGALKAQPRKRRLEADVVALVGLPVAAAEAPADVRANHPSSVQMDRRAPGEVAEGDAGDDNIAGAAEGGARKRQRKKIRSVDVQWRHDLSAALARAKSGNGGPAEGHEAAGDAGADAADMKSCKICDQFLPAHQFRMLPNFSRSVNCHSCRRAINQARKIGVTPAQLKVLIANGSWEQMMAPADDAATDYAHGDGASLLAAPARTPKAKRPAKQPAGGRKPKAAIGSAGVPLPVKAESPTHCKPPSTPPQPVPSAAFLFEPKDEPDEPAAAPAVAPAALPAPAVIFGPTKKCNLCAHMLPVTSFSTIANTAKTRSYCKDCDIKVNRGSRKGFTADELRQALAAGTLDQVLELPRNPNGPPKAAHVPRRRGSTGAARGKPTAPRQRKPRASMPTPSLRTAASDGEPALASANLDANGAVVCGLCDAALPAHQFQQPQNGVDGDNRPLCRTCKPKLERGLCLGLTPCAMRQACKADQLDALLRPPVSDDSPSSGVAGPWAVPCAGPPTRCSRPPLVILRRQLAKLKAEDAAAEDAPDAGVQGEAKTEVKAEVVIA